MEKMFENTYIIVYVFAWVILLKRQKAKAMFFGPCCFIMLTYVGYAIISLLLYNSDTHTNYFDNITLIPFVYLFFMLILALWPSMKYERRKVTSIQHPSQYLIDGFIFMYCLCVVCTLPTTIGNMSNGLKTLFSASNGGAQLYHYAYETRQASDHSVAGFVGLFSVAQTCFRDMFVFITFYYLTLKNRKKWIIILFATVFAIDVLSSIASGGRTFTVMFSLTAGVAYFTFYRFWNLKTRKMINKMALVAGVCIFIPFVALTISRFVNRSSTGGVRGSLLYYIGQANLYFNMYAFNSNGIRYGDRTMNEFKRLLGFDTPNGIQQTRMKYHYMNINDGIYSTFVGDFVFDYGPIMAFIIFAVFCILLTKITKCRGKQIPFHKLLAIYFTMCVCAHGGMYLFYYSYVYNWVILAFLIMYIIFHIDYDQQRRNGRLINRGNL